MEDTGDLSSTHGSASTLPSGPQECEFWYLGGSFHICGLLCVEAGEAAWGNGGEERDASLRGKARGRIGDLQWHTARVAGHHCSLSSP